MKKGYCCKHYLELLLTSFGLLYLIFFLVCLVKIALKLRSLALLTLFVCFLCSHHVMLRCHNCLYVII